MNSVRQGCRQPYFPASRRRRGTYAPSPPLAVSQPAEALGRLIGLLGLATGRLGVMRRPSSARANGEQKRAPVNGLSSILRELPPGGIGEAAIRKGASAIE
jgi:hypothetical protein